MNKFLKKKKKKAKRVFTSRRLCVVVILIWIVSTLSSLPIMEATIFKKQKHYTLGKQVDVCYTSIIERWQIAYLFLMLFFFYVLPCKVLLVLYGKIVFKIKNRNKKNSFIKNSISTQNNNNENDLYNTMYKQSSIPRIRLFSTKEEKVKEDKMNNNFNWQNNNRKSKEFFGDESKELDLRLAYTNKKGARSPKVNAYNSSLKYRLEKFKFSSDSLKRSSSYNDLNNRSYSIASLQNGLRNLTEKNITLSTQFSAKKGNNKNVDRLTGKSLIESDFKSTFKNNKCNAVSNFNTNKNYKSYEGLKFSFSSVNKSRESIEGKTKSKSKSKSTSSTNTNLLITPQSRQSSQPKQSGGGTKHLPQINQKPIVILLIIMMLLIMIALLPYRIFSLWVALANKEKVRSLGLVKFFSLLTYCRVAYYSNSALNPIFYHIISTKFQNAFKKFFKLSYAPSILSNQSGTFRRARRFSHFKASK
jgi:hypothetical protein